MGGAEEAGFVGRGGEIDAFVHGGVEELGEFLRFARLDVGEGFHFLASEEDGKHRPRLIDAEGNA